MRYAHLAPTDQFAAVECLVPQSSIESTVSAASTDTRTDNGAEHGSQARWR